MRVTDRCAIVNDSIAPNAYRLPRNVGLAGDQREAAIALNMMIPTHGVRKRGCSWRRRSGTWRWIPIE